ncbi:hypothetical protein PQR57_13555 [Paraburkholderia dipogonis]|uniref:DUF1311 domain-containing protein n=1 Tax=Paraburkholderia dipogonis TaxID=1211383 RepID=A0ABW9ARC3_9BURK
MNTLLIILWLAGAGTFLAGVGGFVDGRKVDRRFKTGYRNNAPDTRNFRQARKRVMWGGGICIVAMVAGTLSSSNEDQQRDDTATASVPASSTTVTSAAASAESASATLLAIPASDGTNASDASVSLSSNEQVVQAAPVPAPSVPVGVSAAAESAPAVVNSGSQTACNDDGTFLGNNICKSPALATIYQRELEEYEAAQSRIGGADVGVRTEQERWLAQVAQDCPDMQCFTTAFDKRIADLSSRYHGG